MIPNSAYDDWIARDQALMTLINTTLSPATLAYVVGSTSSKESGRPWFLWQRTIYCAKSVNALVIQPLTALID